MLTKLKKTVESLLKAEAAAAHRAGLTPNMISGIGVVLGLASGIFYWQAGQFMENQERYLYYIVSAIVLLLASGYCDALDGTLARLYGKTTVAGGFIDSLLDRYVEAAVYCGLIIGGLCNVFWGLLALIGSLLTSYARARSEAANVPMETIGIVERAERLIIIILASILSVVRLEILQLAIVLLAIITNLTVAQRAYYFIRRVKS
ncbi:MAG: CDP-alcohol phosphatidyltransferase family protein [Candidatus Bathyarchaeia archaeon]